MTDQGCWSATPIPTAEWAEPGEDNVRVALPEAETALRVIDAAEDQERPEMLRALLETTANSCFALGESQGERLASATAFEIFAEFLDAEDPLGTKRLRESFAEFLANDLDTVSEDN